MITQITETHRHYVREFIFEIRFHFHLHAGQRDEFIPKGKLITKGIIPDCMIYMRQEIILIV